TSLPCVWERPITAFSISAESLPRRPLSPTIAAFASTIGPAGGSKSSHFGFSKLNHGLLQKPRRIEVNAQLRCCPSIRLSVYFRCPVVSLIVDLPSIAIAIVPTGHP